MQDGPVIDRERLAGVSFQLVFEPTFEEREPIRVEQCRCRRGASGGRAGRPRTPPGTSSAGGSTHRGGVPAPPRRSWWPCPATVPASRDGVVLVVELVAEQEQVPLLGAEQEHQPHHHRQGGFVQPASGTPFSSVPRLSRFALSIEGTSTSTACRT